MEHDNEFDGCGSTALMEEDPHANELAGRTLHDVGQQNDRQADIEGAAQTLRRRWATFNVTAITRLLDRAENRGAGECELELGKLVAAREQYVMENMEGVAA